MLMDRGITLAPGSGMIMAEMLLADIESRKPNLAADVSGLAPHRFGSGRESRL